jgi:hypothetical protein
MKIISVGIIITLSCVAFAGILARNHFLPNKPSSTSHKNTGEEKLLLSKMKPKADELKRYISTRDFNRSICFLVDMSIESGQNRFLIYDLNKDSILESGLVTHGRCNQTWLQGRKYGNTIGCGCTSLGKYKVGMPYKGRFGLAYKLHGLDASNDNAYARFVVLHSMECVPGKEVSPLPICQSDGCPTVSPDFLIKLKNRIDKSVDPVLLWIFN